MKFRRFAAFFALACSGPACAVAMSGCSILDKLRGGEADAAPSVSALVSALVSAPESTTAAPGDPLAPLAATATATATNAAVVVRTDGGIVDAGALKDGATTSILTPLPPGFSAIPSITIPTTIPSTLPTFPAIPSGILIPRLPASVRIPVAK